MIIDVHAHYLPPSYVRALAAAGIDRPDGFPRVPEWSPDRALALMDDVGVDFALISISSPGVGFAPDVPALARAVNEEGADAVRAHPERLGLLASVPLPNVDAALAEINYASDELGADGFVLMTNYDGVYLGDERLDPVMAELHRRQAVVALHPTSPPGWEAVALGRPRPLIEFPFDTTRAILNLILGGTLAAYPDIRVIVPHAGAALPVLGDRVEAFMRAFEGEAGVLDALTELFYDLAGAALPNALAAVSRLAGMERLMYGSDTPFNPQARIAADLDQLGLALGADIDAVFSRNALRLFPRLLSTRPSSTPA